MRRLRERFPDELVVIGVHSAKFPAEKLTANIRAAVMRLGIDHPVVNDAGFRIWQEYAVRAWPTIVIIDAEGRVVATKAGEIDADQLAPTIDKLVAAFDAKGRIDRSPDAAMQPEIAKQPDTLLQYPSKVLADTSRGGKRLYIADTRHNRIVEAALSGDGTEGIVLRKFGSGARGMHDGSAADATFDEPHGMTLHEDFLYVADTGNHAVRRIDLVSGDVIAVAGTGRKAETAIAYGMLATQTDLRSPWAVAAAGDVVLVAMAGSHQIWALIEERLVPFAGNGREALVDGPRFDASFNQPSELAIAFNHLLIADSEASAIRAIRLDEENPSVATLIGQGLFEFGDVDGVGAEVRLQHPTGLTVAGDAIYIADTYNNKIKKLDPTNGRTESLIGTGQSGAVDGTFAEAELSEPEGIAALEMELYIADTNNHRVCVADLESHTIVGVQLREPARRRVTPAAVVGQGESGVRLRIVLPPGHHLNEENESTVRDVDRNALFPITTDLEARQGPEERGRPARGTAGGSPAALNLAIPETARELLLEVTIYHCADSSDVCLIDDSLVTIPIERRSDGASFADVELKVGEDQQS